MRKFISGAVAGVLCVLSLSCCPAAPPAVPCPSPPEPHPALEDPLVTQARSDACAALEWATNLPLCDMAPLVPQGGREYAAMVPGNGTVRVTYSRNDLSRVAHSFGYSATVGIIGHELGHVHDLAIGAEFHGGATFQQQLSADIAGGCAIGVLGLDLEPFQRVLVLELSSDRKSGEVRSHAARIGYEECRALAPEAGKH